MNILNYIIIDNGNYNGNLYRDNNIYIYIGINI